MKYIKILALLLIFIASPAYSITDNFSMLTDIVGSFSAGEKEKSIKVATDKFMQANISSSWDDFLQIINRADVSNVELLMLNEKMSEYGFFSLAKISVIRNTDENLKFYQQTIQDFYSSKVELTKDEELFLAGIYSKISFNEQQVEAVEELSKKKELLKKSDYANYLMALGLYKSNNYKAALKSVNSAISMNSKCQNYKFLKTRLLAELGRRKDALNLFESYSKKKELPYNYRKKCELLKQFILYKTEKNQWERNYALGRFYYTEGDYQKALKSLQYATLTKNKKDLSKAWALISRTYLKLGDEKKAKEYAVKANDSSNKDANVTLARLEYAQQNYKQAQEYFKKAVKKDKLDSSIIKVGQIYNLLGEGKKAEKVFKKILKNGKDEWEAYYNLALMDSTNKEEYLLKALKYNPEYKDAWYELVKIEIESKNYAVAQSYLKNLLYIDENDYRYYYYQGVITRILGDKSKAAYYFNKSVQINPDYYDAVKALIELKEYI